jgi:hypothetical protein
LDALIEVIFFWDGPWVFGFYAQHDLVASASTSPQVPPRAYLLNCVVASGYLLWSIGVDAPIA